MNEARPSDRNALSFWFPKLVAAGLPVPRTILLRMPEIAQADVEALFDGKEGPGGMMAFAAEIAAAAAPLGCPFFLRTDHTAAKHSWEETCFVRDPSVIAQHVFAIAERSELCGVFGLPWRVWVARELLPTIPLAVCPRYAGMPVCREFRVFVEDDEVVCFHPYWPKESLEQGGVPAQLLVPLFSRLCELDAEDRYALTAIASRAGEALGGAWSVDILETRRGWFVTDMARAGDSFHWPGCCDGHRFQREVPGTARDAGRLLDGAEHNSMPGARR